MLERSLTSEETAAGNGPLPNSAAPPGRAESLEERVHRLEDAVAHLQDTHAMEERIIERVSARLSHNDSQAFQEAGGFFGTDRRSPHAESAKSEAIHADEPLRAAYTGWRGWLLFLDAYQEVRLFWRMYLDRRYRPTWLGRIAPPVILLMILLSYWWIPFLSLLWRPIAVPIDKAVDLVLAFVLIKILFREAGRYRAVVTDLSASPRR